MLGYIISCIFDAFVGQKTKQQSFRVQFWAALCRYTKLARLGSFVGYGCIREPYPPAAKHRFYTDIRGCKTLILHLHPWRQELHTRTHTHTHTYIYIYIYIHIISPHEFSPVSLEQAGSVLRRWQCIWRCHGEMLWNPLRT